MKRAGETVRHTGLYRVTHEGHRTAHEAILWQGEIFPTCRSCGNAATFQFVQPLPESDQFEHVGYDGDFLDSVLGGSGPEGSRLSA